jgi:hypothetical protein
LEFDVVSAVFVLLWIACTIAMLAFAFKKKWKKAGISVFLGFLAVCGITATTPPSDSAGSLHSTIADTKSIAKTKHENESAPTEEPTQEPTQEPTKGPDEDLLLSGRAAVVNVDVGVPCFPDKQDYEAFDKGRTAGDKYAIEDARSTSIILADGVTVLGIDTSGWLPPIVQLRVTSGEYEGQKCWADSNYGWGHIHDQQ